MSDRKMLSYMKTSLEKGSSLQEITEQLKQKGWPDYMITEAVKEISTDSSEIKLSLKRKRFRLTSLVKFLLIILIISTIIYSAIKIFPLLSP